MPSPQEILDGLTELANRWWVVAANWHGLIALIVLRDRHALLGGPSKRPAVTVGAQ
ncbi:MAG: hypothetical protein WC809_17225 [Sinimarinibacterium sp.]|jgi:hypothetical protein